MFGTTPAGSPERMLGTVMTSQVIASIEPRRHDGRMRNEMGLRRALRANAIFSTVSGLSGLVAADEIVDLLGVGEAWMVRSLGVGLLLFAAAVVAVSLRPCHQLVRESMLVTVADLGWVSVSAVLIALGSFSPAGAFAIGAVAVVVCDLAVVQLWARAPA